MIFLKVKLSKKYLKSFTKIIHLFYTNIELKTLNQVVRKNDLYNVLYILLKVDKNNIHKRQEQILTFKISLHEFETLTILKSEYKKYFESDILMNVVFIDAIDNCYKQISNITWYN